mmetsp:Transcript_29302/g.52694  ORF Transcript_29302/g.52694 Transcript_29302/m.52694 type:complete len:142 (-) Transcript_29302:607-1032(-)
MASIQLNQCTLHSPQIQGPKATKFSLFCPLMYRVQLTWSSHRSIIRPSCFTCRTKGRVIRALIAPAPSPTMSANPQAKFGFSYNNFRVLGTALRTLKTQIGVLPLRRMKMKVMGPYLRQIKSLHSRSGVAQERAHQMVSEG